MVVAGRHIGMVLLGYQGLFSYSPTYPLKTLSMEVPYITTSYPGPHRPSWRQVTLTFHPQISSGRVSRSKQQSRQRMLHPAKPIGIYFLGEKMSWDAPFRSNSCFSSCISLTDVICVLWRVFWLAYTFFILMEIKWWSFCLRATWRGLHN